MRSKHNFYYFIAQGHPFVLPFEQPCSIHFNQNIRKQWKMDENVDLCVYLSWKGLGARLISRIREVGRVIECNNFEMFHILNNYYIII